MSHTGNVTGSFLGSFSGHGSANYSKNDLLSPDFLLQNMLFWYDTSIDSCAVLSESSLIELRDLSQNGLTLAPFSAAPSWDANNKVGNFNGSSQWLISTATVSLPLNGDFTLVTLLNPSVSQNGVNTPLDLQHEPNNGLVLQNETNKPAVNNYYFAWNNGAGFNNVGSSFLSLSANTWSLAVMIKVGAVANAYLNGSQSASFPTTQTSLLRATNRKVSIGNSCAQDIQNRWWSGSFAGAILLNRSLSLIEIQKLEGAILWPRGWQSNLPANHPYRNRPPLVGD
jgi:hypothetical protein